jgi:Ice-binding-like
MVAVPLAITVLTGAAWAYWTVASVPGGTGASAVASVDQGARPTAAAAGGAVTVGWAASTLSSGDPVTGYLVSRYDASTLARATVQAGCAGALVALSCTEAGVPTGSWVYSVTPVVGLSWRGPESPKSSAVTTDATTPVNVISTAATVGTATESGDTVFYRGAAAGSLTLTNAVSDSGSGPASSTTAALSGDATGWSHVPSVVSTPSGGPYVSNPFSWTAVTTSGPTEVVTGRDQAGNTARTTLSFVDDSVAPTAGMVDYTDGYQPAQSVVVDLAPGTDAGSGIATRQLERSSAPIATTGCGVFGGFLAVGPDSPASPYTDAQVANGFCYRYRFVVTDRVGNQDIATSPHVAEVNAAPTLGSAGSFSVLAGVGVVNTGVTSLSGDLGVSPGSSIVGFPPGTVSGTVHAGDAAAAQAQTDLAAAYHDAAARTADSQFAGDLNGRTFHAGVYHTSAALALTGTVTLDAQGDPNAVFIFQVDAALNTAAGSVVNLVNGAQPSHVYWQVAGAAGTGASAIFAGTILAAGAITLGASSQLIGRALSSDTVTLAANTITTG